MPPAYTEDQLVERPAIGLFAELGWTTISALQETFSATGTYICEASRMMELGARVERLLLTPEGEHHVTVPIERDNGELAVFAGYRIQHNSARGPMKGACAFIPRWMPRKSEPWLR
jgi:hypothetical protein